MVLTCSLAIRGVGFNPLSLPSTSPISQTSALTSGLLCKGQPPPPAVLSNECGPGCCAGPKAISVRCVCSEVPYHTKPLRRLGPALPSFWAPMGRSSAAQTRAALDVGRRLNCTCIGSSRASKGGTQQVYRAIDWGASRFRDHSSILPISGI